MVDSIIVEGYEIFKDRLYTKTHEWIKIHGENGIVGITDYAQKELQDITYVELPDIGIEVSQGEEVATVESVKHTSPIYSPVSGEIINVNENLEEEPDIINKNPYGDGWIFEIKLTNPGEIKNLLSPEIYADLVRAEKKS
ncbi:MAG: glycine cleavage system protein GcvH [Desulfurococcales archaeon]|nr:glycine cleavage system protein GcvH [Desulfurococcales archaeon]